MILVCAQHDWTMHQYKSNPDWFLELLASKIKIEQSFNIAREKSES